jgi:hypothetical protein
LITDLHNGNDHVAVVAKFKSVFNCMLMYGLVIILPLRRTAAEILLRGLCTQKIVAYGRVAKLNSVPMLPAQKIKLLMLSLVKIKQASIANL